MNAQNPQSPGNSPRPEDDPRLVAYVLGGLEAPEVAEVEALLESDAEAGKYVEEMRALARQLEGELAAEGSHGLHPAQREAVESAASQRASRAPRPWLAPVLLLAAGLVLAASAWSWRTWLGEDSYDVDKSRKVAEAPREDSGVASSPTDSAGRPLDRESSNYRGQGDVVPPSQEHGAPTNPPATVLLEEEIEELRRLEALGYATGDVEVLEVTGVAAFEMNERSRGIRFDRAGVNAEPPSEDGFFDDTLDGDGAVDGRNAGDDAGESSGADVPGKFDKANKKFASTWKRAQATPNASRLSIGDKEDLPLMGMQARVQVDGFRARVLLDCWYYNDRDQQYEGTFKLRLPDGASPYCFAFGESVSVVPDGILRGDVFYSAVDARKMGWSPADIMRDRRDTWKQPKEARMVPREKAAHAYGETVRRRVDPALMEWAGSGVFQARVFPLAPGALHRIVVGYDMDLGRVGDRLEFALDLPALDVPMTVDLDIGTGDVAVGNALDFVVSPEATPTINGQRRQYHFDDAAGARFALLCEDAPPLCLTGSDVDLGEFFAASFSVPVKAEEETTSGTRRAVFLLDTSLSSTPDLFQVWARLLPALLEENADSLEEFAVLCFDVSSRWWQPRFVRNDAANRAQLQEFVDGLALEGATDLAAALRRAARPEWPEAEDSGPHDLFLLSDGSATWGESEHLALSRALTGGQARALFAYRTGHNGTDLRALEHLARESDGAVFAVTGEDQLQAVAKAHRQAPWRLKDIALEGCSDLLVQGRPAHVYPGQALVLTGRGTPVPDAEVLVDLSRGTETRRVPVSLNQRLASPLAARVYGQVAVQQLETWAEATEDTSKAYATHFRVTGRTCSLLMLETEEDYQRFGIRPEEDAFVIQRSPVTERVAAAVADLAETLGSSKRRFLAFLERLGGMPGMEFQAPAALLLALEGMPEDSFSVVTPVLDCRQEDFEGTPGSLQDLLAGRRVDYEMLVQEAARRHEAYGAGDALKALSSLVEVQPGDAVVARDVAFSALEWGLGATAYHLLHRVAESRPYEPQTYWNLALCLEQMGKTDLALAWYEVAMAGQWNARFGEIHRIVGVDYLRFLRRIQKGELETSVEDYAAARARSLGESLGIKSAALLITMQWNTDRTDVDMHVIEPSGEECYYSNRDTRIGGHMTTDVTQGFGPEMYTLIKPVRGTFRVLAHYFASDNNRAGVRSKVYTSVYRDWGTDQETVVRRVVTLERGKDKHELLTLEVK